MHYRLGVEDIEPGHWVAWAFDLPGCYCSAGTQEQTVAGARASIVAYHEWLRGHGWSMGFQPRPENVVVEVVEVFHSFESEPGYTVNAFFEDDRRPLSRDEIDAALWLLSCTRRDLLSVVKQIPPEQRQQPGLDPAFDSIDGVLKHIAGAEWWYLDRLGLAFPRDDMPEEPLTRLEQVRARTNARLPELVGDERVETRSGEMWSARKVVRRALWHERDHTAHVAKLGGT